VLLQTEFPKPLDEILADMARSDQWEGELVHTRRDGTKVIVAARWAIQHSREPHRAEILEINAIKFRGDRKPEIQVGARPGSGSSPSPARVLFFTSLSDSRRVLE